MGNLLGSKTLETINIRGDGHLKRQRNLISYKLFEYVDFFDIFFLSFQSKMFYSSLYGDPLKDFSPRAPS